MLATADLGSAMKWVNAFHFRTPAAVIFTGFPQSAMNFNDPITNPAT